MGGAPTSRFVTSDKDNNIFYAKGAAIMKVDALSGTVTRFAGSVTSAACTMATGANPLTTLFTSPQILGMNSARDSILIASCSKIFSINTSTNYVTQWATFTGSLNKMYLTKNRIFLYLDSGCSCLKLIDLSTQGGTPTTIFGNGSCDVTTYTVGDDALSIPYKKSPHNGACYSYDLHLTANADASKIWVSPYFTSNAYRLDLVSGVYKVGSADLGYDASDYSTCVFSEYDNYNYCAGRSTGRVIRRYSSITGAYYDTSTMPFDNSDNSGSLSIGSMADKLVAHYSLNNIQVVDTPNTGAWTYTRIAGDALSVMGNGGAPVNAGLDQPVDIRYISGSQKLYVRNRSGHLRIVDMSVTPNVVSTIFHANLWDVGMQATIGINPAADKILTLGSCARYFLFNFTLGTTSLTAQNSFFGGGCSTSVGTYPVATGTNAGNGDLLVGGSASTMTASPLYHSNGYGYFAAASPDQVNNIMLFYSDTSTITKVGGVAGVGGYVAGDHGNSLATATFSKIKAMQELSGVGRVGDVLIVDGDRVRLLTIGTQAGSPKVYDVMNLTLAAGYSAGSAITEFIYDENTEIGGVLGTGNIYYSVGASVKKWKANGALTSATDTAYTFSGTTLYSPVRISLTPAGLLVLQYNQSRILRVSP